MDYSRNHSETSTGPFGRGQPELHWHDRRLDISALNTEINQFYLELVTDIGRLRGEVSQDTIRHLSDEIALHALGFCSTQEIDYSELPSHLDLQNKNYSAKTNPKLQVLKVMDLVREKNISKSTDGVVFPPATTLSEAQHVPAEHQVVTRLNQNSNPNGVSVRSSSSSEINATTQALWRDKEEEQDVRTPALERSSFNDSPSTILVTPEQYDHELERTIAAHENFSQISLAQLWGGEMTRHENFSQLSPSPVRETSKEESLDTNFQEGPVSNSTGKQKTECDLTKPASPLPTKAVMFIEASPLNATFPHSHCETAQPAKPGGSKSPSSVRGKKEADSHPTGSPPRCAEPITKPRNVSFAVTTTVIPSQETYESLERKESMHQDVEEGAFQNTHKESTLLPAFQPNASPILPSSKAIRRRNARHGSSDALHSAPETNEEHDAIVNDFEPTHVRAMQALVETSKFIPEPKRKERNWQIFRPLPLGYEGINLPIRKLDEFPDPQRMLEGRAVGIIQATKKALREQELKAKQETSFSQGSEVEVEVKQEEEEAKWNPVKRLRKMKSDYLSDKPKEKESIHRPYEARRRTSASEIGEKKSRFPRFQRRAAAEQNQQ